MSDHPIREDALVQFLRELSVPGSPGAQAADRIESLTAERDQLRAELERAIEAKDSEEGMASCMRMLRDDLIHLGLIGDSVPPMFMTEAICELLQKKDAELERVRRASSGSL